VPPQQIVDTPDDRCTLIEDVSRCEAEPLPITHDQIPLPFQISLMNLGFTMHGSVVFMDATSSLDPQVSTGQEPSVLVDNHMLRLYRDIRHAMHHSQH
jgi:hypothetical protein